MQKISFARLISHEEERSRMLSSCTDLGFFFLELPKEELNLTEAFRVSKAIFSLETTRTNPVFKYNPKLNSGYLGVGLEALNESVELKEAFNIRKDLILMDNQSLPVTEGETLNTLKDFTRSCHSISLRILKSLELSLGLPLGTFSARHRIDFASGDVLRFLHYPAAPPLGKTQRCGAHSDFGSLTLLFLDPLASSSGGLEILSPTSDKFEAVVLPPATGQIVIVNIGDLLEFFTKDLLRSTVHRVVATISNEPRYSIAYFLHAEDSSSLEPIEVLKGMPREARYSSHSFQDGSSAKLGNNLPLTAKDHLIQRLVSSRK